MLDLVYRPIDTWPGERTVIPQRAPFSAPWGNTLKLLERELRMLDATQVVVQVALRESDFRIDGQPKARATATHPGIIVAFESKHGPLKYATDLFLTWSDNIRAVALSLEALRKVDRYGVSTRGEQYRGWKELPAGVTVGLPMSAADAARVLLDLADEDNLLGYYPEKVIADAAVREELWTIAVRLHHPDHAGGNPDLFRRANEARSVLQGAAQ